MNRTYPPSPLSPAYRKAAAEIARYSSRAPVERLEDVLSDLMGGVVINPHRQPPPIESETTETPRPRETPERPSQSGLDD